MQKMKEKISPLNPWILKYNKEYYEQLAAHKFDNFNEIETFLESHKV